MKKSLIILAVLVLAIGVTAQQRTGNLYGKISDTENTPLPGVAVTLSAPILAPTASVTNVQGIYRFPGLPPGSEYTLKCELTGFKTSSKTGIIIAVGANVEINLILEVGKLEENITVTAITPVVDSKKTTVSTNYNNEELQSLPTARDPWVVMQLAPAIMLDRENVGGNESGQQSSFLARGDVGNNFYVGANNIWAMDGVDLTDPAALGGSALYFDFDSFEEMNIVTGGADVSIQTGGIALNMITRRGGNKANLAGRFYLTDNFFQANNLTADLQAQGVRAINRIWQIKDYGFNAGGPIIKDKLWWWGAYGVQDIFTYTMYNTADKTLLGNYNFKLNAQIIPNNRFEALVTAGAKEKYGRNAAVAKPEGDHQKGKYHWGSPILKLQDEHIFGDNFFVTLKYSFNDAGFGWVPMTDETMDYPVVYDQTTRAFSGALYTTRSWGWYYASRPRNNAQAAFTYFNDALLGMSHEIKAGFEYSNKHGEHYWGNSPNFQVNINYNTPQFDTTGDGVKDIPASSYKWFAFNRVGRDNSDVRQYAGYLQDTITKGSFTVLLGLRYDYQKSFSSAYDIPAVLYDTAGYTGAGPVGAWSKVMGNDVKDKLDSLMPGISVNDIDPNYAWNTFSPRLGITWDIFGNGKTIAKLSVAQYGDVMGLGNGISAPLGTGGWMGMWWNDVNADKQMQFGELFWMRSSVAANKFSLYPIFDASGNFLGNWADGRGAGMYAGWDPLNPTTLNYDTNTATFEESAKASSRTRELLVTLEREIFTDFAASINFSMRRYDNFQWWQGYYPDTGMKLNNSSYWVQAGTIPATVGPYSTGGAAGRPWYVLRGDIPPADYNYVSIGDNYNTYWGLDFVVTKRLSNKWFMNASFTFQDQRQYGGNTWLDTTNKWMTEGKAYAQWGGGASGKTAVAMYSKWMAKISALYKLPWDVDLSGTFQAREGWKVPHYFYIEDDRIEGLYYSNWINTQEISQDSLPTFYNFTLRLEKMVKMGDFGRLYFMADVFNALNSAIINRAYDAYLGDYYVSTNTFVENATNRYLNEILNPRITRFGVRFQF